MTVREIYRRPTVIAGIAIVLAMAATGTLAPFLTPHDPLTANLQTRSCPPLACETDGRSHILGTDIFGRDMLSRIVASFRTYLYIGLAGTLAGFIAAWLWLALLSVGEASPTPDAPRPLFGVPFWGLAILSYCASFLPCLMIVALMGSSSVLIVVCAGLFAAPLPMALLYDSVKRDDASDASSGEAAASDSYLVYETVRDNVASPDRVGLAMSRGIALGPVAFSLALLTGMFIEFYLSFLGVGLPPHNPSLGNMVAAARMDVTIWWMVVFPLGVGLTAAGALAAIAFPVSRILTPARAAGADSFRSWESSPAGFGIRFAGQLIDLGIVFAAVIVYAILAAVMDLPPSAAIALGITLVGIIIITSVGSPGKRAVGLSVLRLDGSPAGWGRKLLRYLVSLWTFFIIDLLMIAFRKDRRALHDLVCGTIVVRHRDADRPAIPGAGAAN